MAEPIRILQCFGIMGRGGAETLIMNIYRNIDREKVQFDFVVHRNETSAFDDEIYSMGGKIFKVPRYTVTNHLQYRKAWHDLFKAHANVWSIIHGHIFTTAAIYLKIAKKYSLITIAHSHNISSGIGFSARIKDLLQYPIKFNKDYYFACSRAAGEWLFGKNVCQEDSFFVLRNAIEAKKFKYNGKMRRLKRKQLHIDDYFVIGHIGRFETQKNHVFLIDIFKKVNQINPKTVLLLIGDGPLRELIIKKVKNLELSDNVIFTGVRSDIPDLLQSMDLFLFPSLYEGLGIVSVEAQAAGLHCVVADTIPEEAYVTDLIETESLKAPADRWAERILKYANGYKRIDTSEQIKTRSYDIAETAKWLEDFYLKEHARLLSNKKY